MVARAELQEVGIKVPAQVGGDPLAKAGDEIEPDGAHHAGGDGGGSDPEEGSVDQFQQ